MGNTHTKNHCHDSHKYTSQYSLSDLIGGSCVGSTHLSDKHLKPWSHASHRSWSEGTLQDPLGSSKTLWPVARTQSIFLPEFQIRQIPLQHGYTFLNVIAKGAFGKVYKIQSKDSGQLFALKVISKAKVVTENAVQQAKQEVAIQKLIGHHPFVLNCCYKWQGRRTLYILTDYVGGGELYSLVEQCGPLPEQIVRIYMAELALAVDFLHNAGIVHRDIKATNVLLDNEGHAVLIDFGLAKWLNHSERTNTICGTPEYMAPEIFKKEYYGQEVDWWSLGVLACFLLTNQYPSIGPTELLPDDRIVDYRTPGTLPSNAEMLSPAAEDLIKRLLQPDPRLRLKSLRALQRIAFYMGYDLQSYMLKKESPFRLLGRKVEEDVGRMSREFSGFDSMVGDSFSYADDR